MCVATSQPPPSATFFWRLWVSSNILPIILQHLSSGGRLFTAVVVASWLDAYI